MKVQATFPSVPAHGATKPVYVAASTSAEPTVEDSYAGPRERSLGYKLLTGATTGALVGGSSAVLATSVFLSVLSGTPLAPAGNALATTLLVGVGVGLTLGAGAGVLGHLNPGYIDFEPW